MPSTRALSSRLRSLERLAPTVQASCPSCEHWHVEYREEGEPDPPHQCDGCGRCRPSSPVWLIRVVPVVAQPLENVG